MSLTPVDSTWFAPTRPRGHVCEPRFDRPLSTVARRALQKRGDGLKETEAIGLGIDRRRPQLGEEGACFIGKHAGELRSPRTESQAQTSGRNVTDDRAKRLDPGPIRGCSAGLPGSAPCDPRAARYGLG